MGSCLIREQALEKSVLSCVTEKYASRFIELLTDSTEGIGRPEGDGEQIKDMVKFKIDQRFVED